MPTLDDRDPLLVPPQSRLLYIGPPKTGTTALQEAARAARPQLFEQGVLYPGTRPDHRQEVYAFMRRKDEGDRSIARRMTRTKAGRIPPLKVWQSMMAEIEAEPSKRVLISHEAIARSSDATAQKFVSELGHDRTHVVITLRPLSKVLPSRWIQNVKEGLVDDFDEWLQRVYGYLDRPISEHMQRYLDQGSLVDRWADIVGPENVTVIVLDKSEKNRLTDTFERMLGLHEGTLTRITAGGSATNRSMSMPEAKVLREVNSSLHQSGGISWPLYFDVLGSGAIERLLDHRNPGEMEPHVRLPDWAAKLATRDEMSHAERIEKSGVRIVGNLDSLCSEPVATNDGEQATDQWSHSIAVESLIGAYNGALSFERNATNQITRARELSDEQMALRKEAVSEVERLKDGTLHQKLKHLTQSARVQQAAESFTTRDLINAVSRRLRHRLGTGKSLRLK